MNAELAGQMPANSRVVRMAGGRGIARRPCVSESREELFRRGRQEDRGSALPSSARDSRHVRAMPSPCRIARVVGSRRPASAAARRRRTTPTRRGRSARPAGPRRKNVRSGWRVRSAEGSCAASSSARGGRQGRIVDECAVTRAFRRRGGLATRERRAFRRTGSITCGAALVSEITHQLVHHAVVGAVDELPAGAQLRDESRALQRLQMKRERGGHQAHAFADDTGRQARGALFHQQAIDGQPVFVRQRAERLDDVRGFHGGTILRLLSKRQSHASGAE